VGMLDGRGRKSSFPRPKHSNRAPAIVKGLTRPVSHLENAVEVLLSQRSGNAGVEKSIERGSSLKMHDMAVLILATELVDMFRVSSDEKWGRYYQDPPDMYAGSDNA
jgi:hypothetical protein